MNRFVSILVTLSIAIIAYFIGVHHFKPVELPPIESKYFGAGAVKQDDVTIKPFTVTVSDTALVDLKSRLLNTKFFDGLENAKFTYGMNPVVMKKVQKYWIQEFDWNKQVQVINQHKHFHTQIEGLNVHFIRASPPAGKYAIVRPLLIVHGWPGSVWEFYKIIPMLTDPNKHLGINSQVAFEIIAPSIPGFGWSEAPKKQGFGPLSAARVFAVLMKRLKYDSYYCQGGDWGSFITTSISQMYPQRVLGLHLNMAQVTTPFYPALLLRHIVGIFVPSLAVSAVDYDKVYPMQEIVMHLLQETGYFHIQATKPDTVGFALQDSPIGLAAYILEKFSTWTNKMYVNLEDGGLLRDYTMDDLLTNVMIYWTTNTIVSSQRIYKETFADPNGFIYDKAGVFVPTGFASFPQEIERFPQNFLEYKFRNITHYEDMTKGGHFPAFEQPKLLAMDIFKFQKTVENN